MEISTPGQLLRSLGPLPETSARNPNPPKLQRSPSRGFSSHKAGWKILLLLELSLGKVLNFIRSVLGPQIAKNT